MRVFNSLQIVLAYVASPFGIVYLQQHQDFTGAAAAFYASCALYLVFTGFMTAAVYHGLSEVEKHPW